MASLKTMSEDPNAYFKKGAEVEISSNDDGFRGSWYAGTIVQPARSKNKMVVEYKTLFANDDNDSKKLRETLDIVQLRPPPPRERYPLFQFSDEVDAYQNDGWWEGIITEVLGNGRFSVFFRGTREQIVFDQSEMRLHREWVDGDWVPPLKEEEVSSVSTDSTSFGIGTQVEVSSDEDGFRGAWFTATVVKPLRKDKFLIEYQSLSNEDGTELLQEEVDSFHIRPCPHETKMVNCFKLLEEVDALYNDGWWVGVISKALDNNRYVVFFKETNDEMEFKRSNLRKHQDWINGKWTSISQSLKL